MKSDLQLGGDVYYFQQALETAWNAEEPTCDTLSGITHSVSGKFANLKRYGTISLDRVFATREAAKVARAAAISTDCHKRWEFANKLRTLPLPSVAIPKPEESLPMKAAA